MKTTCLVWKTSRSVAASAVRPVSAGILAVALGLQLGCASHRPTGVIRTGAPAASPVWIDPGVVLVTAPSAPARFSFAQAKGQSDDAEEGAGNWARAALSMAPVGGLAISPVAAAIGAVKARNSRLEPDGLALAENLLTRAMASAAEQQRLRDMFLKTASESTRRQLVPAESAFHSSVRNGPVSTIVETKIEELRLERTGSSDTSFALRIKARLRAVRGSDGTVIYDEPFEYLTGTALFYNWTLDGAVRKVADTGYRKLAEQMSERLFLATRDTPALAGVGFKKRPLPASTARTQFLAGSPTDPPVLRASTGAFQFVHTGALGVYSTSNVPSIVLLLPPTKDEAAEEAVKDTALVLDDFLKCPDLVVWSVGMAAAIPISLWKQTAAIVAGVPAGRHAKATEQLVTAVRETRPHYAIAMEVAQQLAPRTSQQVAHVHKPSPTGDARQAALMQCADRGTFSALPSGLTPMNHILGQGMNTALEINVQSAVLKGDGDVNPPLALCIEAKATILRSSDGQELYSCPVRYRGKSRKMTEWAANDARLFHQEMQRCYGEMSRSITDQLVSRGVVAPLRGPNSFLAVAE